jgi:uroporphyrinogen-III synthase
MIEPLLSIVPISTPRPQPGKIDAIMITSGNALLAVKERQDDLASLFGIPCFRVGPRTAEKARAFGFRRVQNAAGDGAELARFINHARGGTSASVLHIAARDVNNTAREELSARGHSVIEWPVYDTIPAAALTPSTRDLLARQKLDATVVFSPKSGRVLYEFLTGAALEACCARLAAICLSDAVADELRTLPWRHLSVPPRPTENAVIACLQDICPVKP